jgi:hypothetical protein
MPHRPTPPRGDDEPHQICVRIPGWLKGRMLEICEREGISLNAFVSNAIRESERSGRGLPSPPDARPAPTVADVLASYATGEKLVKPCGKTRCDQRLVRLDGYQFCDECGIRIG